MPHRLPPSAYIMVVLSGLLLWACYVIGEQRSQLDAKPVVLETRLDERTEDVRRGPVTITRRTETKPDGTKVVEQKREVAGEERHIAASSDVHHEETPVSALAPRARNRYVGVGVDPLNYARLPRLRAGVTLFDRVDLGVAYDARFAPVSGAFQIEASYRF